MEHGCSLSHSQEPSTCSYCVPDQSSPCPLSHFLNIHFKIILPSTPRSSKWSLSFIVPYQNPACTSPLPYMCHLPHPYHSSWFDHPSNIRGGVQVMKLLVIQSFTCPCFLVCLLLQVRTFTVYLIYVQYLVSVPVLECLVNHIQKSYKISFIRD